jgi:hypothetical protein
VRAPRILAQDSEYAYGRVHRDVAESTIVCVLSTRPTGVENVTILYSQHRSGKERLTLPNRLLMAESSISRGKLVMNNVERQSIVTEISCPSSFRRSFARADDTASTAWNSSRAESDARDSSSSGNIVVSRIRPHYESVEDPPESLPIRKMIQSMRQGCPSSDHLSAQ